MSFSSVWTWTLVRTLLLTVAALPICGAIVRVLVNSSARQRSVLMTLLAVPFLFPELLTGYAYSQTTRLLIRDMWMREAWLDVLLLLRSIPVGVAFWYWSPPPSMTPESLKVRWLAFRECDGICKQLRVRIWFFIHGPGRTLSFVAASLAIVNFHEFELVSLLAAVSWTVWLFDAQAGGLALSESVRCTLAPSLCSLVACSPWIWGSFVKSDQIRESCMPAPVLSNSSRLLVWFYLGISTFLVAIMPLVLLLPESWHGLLAWSTNSTQIRNLFEGVLVASGYALVSGTMSDMVAGWSTRNNQALRTWIRTGCLVIGLPGGLVLSLLLVALFQQPWAHRAYDTPLPVVIGLTLWLLPRAILLRSLELCVRQPAIDHTVLLLGAAPDLKRRNAAHGLWWQHTGRRRVAIRLLLCYWAYWDLTVPSILTPSGMVPSPVRLYIDMHFGRNAVLTAKALLTLAIPIIVTAVCWPVLRRLSLPDLNESDGNRDVTR